MALHCTYTGRHTMAEKSFAINDEPHVAKLGSVEFLFKPEVIGADFADAYAILREAQAEIAAASKAGGESMSGETLKKMNESMRSFIRSFLMDESKKAFDTTAIPDRVLIQLMNWTAELYGGGQGNDRTGSSGAS